jgi:WD40 repeat protein
VGRRAYAGSLGEPGGRVQSVAFSPGGRFLAAADETGQIALWRTPGHAG